MCFIVFYLLFLAFAKPTDRSVIVSTQAPFQPVSLLAESCEFFAQLDSDYYWGFLDYAFEQGLGKKNEEELMKIIYDFTKEATDSSALAASLRATLHVHTFAPFIESQHQMAMNDWHMYASSAQLSKYSTPPPIFAVLVQPYQDNQAKPGRPNGENYLHNNRSVIFTSPEDLKTKLTFSKRQKLDYARLYGSSPIQPVESPTLLNSDHIFPSTISRNTNLPIVILYGSVNDEGMQDWIKMLKSTQEETLRKGPSGENREHFPSFIFTVRHFRNYEKEPQTMLKKEKTENMTVCGYGIELALRDSEYKFGDKGKHGNDAEEDDGDEEGISQNAKDGRFDILPPEYDLPDDVYDTPVLGINIKKMAQRHRHLAAFAETPRSEKNATSWAKADEEEEVVIEGRSRLDRLFRGLIHESFAGFLPIARVKDIGTKTTLHIKTQPDPLGALVDLSDNFPVVGPSIAKMPMSMELRSHLMSVQPYFQGDDALLLVNGRALTGKMSVWSLLSAVTDELKHAVALQQIGMHNTAIRKIAQIPVFTPNLHTRGYDRIRTEKSSFVTETIRVIARPPSEKYFLNNIETDKKYNEWSGDITLLAEIDLNQQYVPSVRRNLVVVTAFLDLARPESQQTIVNMLELLDQGYAIRFGVVPVVSPLLSPTAAQQSSSAQLARWWLAEMRRGGAMNAARMVRGLEKRKQQLSINNVRQMVVMSQHKKGVQNAWMTLEDWKNVTEGKDKQIEEDMKEIKMVLEETLVPVPCLSFNGIICPVDNIEQTVRAYYPQELRLMRQLVMQGELSIPKKKKREDLYLNIPGFQRSNAPVEILWNITRRERWVEKAREIGAIGRLSLTGRKELDAERIRQAEKELGITVEMKMKPNATELEKKRRVYQTAADGFERERAVKRFEEKSPAWVDKMTKMRHMEGFTFVTETKWTPQILNAHEPLGGAGTRSSSADKDILATSVSATDFYAQSSGTPAANAHFVSPTLFAKMMRRASATAQFVQPASRPTQASKGAGKSKRLAGMSENSIASRLLQTSSPLTHFVAVDYTQKPQMEAASSIISAMSGGISRAALLFATKGTVKPLSFPSVFLSTIGIVHPRVTQSYTSFLIRLYYTMKLEPPAGQSVNQTASPSSKREKDQTNEHLLTEDVLVAQIAKWAAEEAKMVKETTKKTSNMMIEDLFKWNATLLARIHNLAQQTAVSSKVKAILEEHNEVIRKLSLNVPLTPLELQLHSSPTSPLASGREEGIVDASVNFLGSEKGQSSSSSLSSSSSSSASEGKPVIPCTFLITNGLVRPITKAQTASLQYNLLSFTALQKETSVKINHFYNAERSVPVVDSVMTKSQMKDLEGWEVARRWMPLWRGLFNCKEEELTDEEISLSWLTSGDESENEKTMNGEGVNERDAEERVEEEDGSSFLAILQLVQGLHCFRYPRAATVDREVFTECNRLDNTFNLMEGAEEQKEKNLLRKKKYEEWGKRKDEKDASATSKAANKDKEGNDDDDDDNEDSEDEEQNTKYLNMMVAINPLVETQRHVGHLLLFLRSQLGDWIEGKVVLCPTLTHHSLPLRSLYRFALFDTPRYTQGGQLIQGPKVVFPQLSPSFVWTLNHHPPSGWEVQQKEAKDDLDNIQFEDLDALGGGKERNVTAVYRISNFLVKGHFHDILNSPASGMPLAIHSLHAPTEASPAPEGSKLVPSFSTTVVLDAKGYFQLPVASPGIHLLSVSPHLDNYISVAALSEQRLLSLSRDGSLLESSVSPVLGEAVLHRSKNGGWLVVNSWEGSRVMGRINMLYRDVNLFSVARSEQERARQKMERNAGRMKEKGKGKNSGTLSLTGVPSTENKPDTIHIFTICSGHLYERLAKIMMMSVLNNTKKPVKFWFLESVISPSFRAELPVMSKRMKFSYQLVDYAWPDGVVTNARTKMRSVWAYKILFLDLLFPVDLERVIFVDADQICKTDMDELMKMDLQGAPYGYTPFCNDRPEMKPYRFWETGYWKEELQGKPYYISALYVVDLNRFREMGAGDTLRHIYEGHAKDKNSLANLDQDLPNTAQSSVPIFTLPQEWLWCGSWCSDATRKKAKTIDLCNNPRTKEHKIDYAKKNIPEWNQYHEKLLQLEDSLSNLTRNATHATKKEPKVQRNEQIKTEL
ncbi:putative UDP-glucose:glycoprotein glucosyltransferase [Monocercomonoides exilis]|uniref:putative UDP-glucose:glycoprotein glucosyltransferase n=1 Tax=Monocercomonoides exilis TaxID=2049356 RepID=UPI00355AC5FF|nr:putative UDP-glucose:glycoprotein glucosyltransferase [Monocercomonoides exilis]|eukprot:MONOS_618.1-p1 / transcript=MONOS_618.1 / gene=MONOS_618 / organism=Monocercomonoides_exilis_PA203 / gene_product=UDP-glucose / transcript_product=UDP-glucose / location=Mono_scaffold00010:21005-27667(-) / protein_length=2134 / sequence_SO=supercontig / SO=protein_coding / is_pseudo=false